ncbi:MAG: CRISPR system precrRNA processing endoribonuclease RAMP protein Cas6 [Venatoribacter sp.]
MLVEALEQPLLIARYRFRFRALTSIRLPDYAGSMLRGAFGHALMLLSGIEKSDIEQRNQTFLYSPYAAVFEPVVNNGVGLLASIKDVAVPYIIEAPSEGAQSYQAGDVLEFDMVLFGQALAHLSVIILAWRRALLHGLGRNKDQKAELVEVLHCAVGDSAEMKTVYSEERPILAPHNTQLFCPNFNETQNLCLHFYTGLRIKKDKKIVDASELTPALLLRNIVRRVSFVLQLQQPDTPLTLDINGLNALADSVHGEHNLQYKRWKRHSSRQQASMDLNGWIGDWPLFNVSAELMPFVWLGQFLHVGKNTSFGLGGYEMGVINDKKT